MLGAKEAPGTYHIVQPVACKSEAQLDSNKLRSIQPGELVEVVEATYLLASDGRRLRGRLSTGGWITISKDQGDGS